VDGRRALVLLLFVAGCSKLKPSSGDSVIALEGATLIDGAGGEPKRDAIIIIRNGHIEQVAQVNQIQVPRGAERINLAGKTIIPGLIDAHAHVERWAAGRYVAWGVTTVRDLHGTTADVLGLKNSFNLGSVLGPRMFVAGAMIAVASTVTTEMRTPLMIVGRASGASIWRTICSSLSPWPRAASTSSRSTWRTPT